jgi:uridylate kinase
MRKIIIISLGGSIVVPEVNKINIEFLRKFKNLILKFVKKGYRFLIVVGGGKINRYYNEIAKSLNKNVKDKDLDLIGIATTKLNACLLRAIFNDFAYRKVISNPKVKIKTKALIIVGSGYKPGHSTDFNTVVLAKNFKTDLIINLTNVDYIYDDDPRKNPLAKPFKKISWNEYLKLIEKEVGKEWKPRMNVPFDPLAARLAKRYGLKVIIANGLKFANFKKILIGKKFVGTIIS